MAPLPHKILTGLGTWVARPIAFLALVVYGVCWFWFDRESLNFHGVAALITLAMTLLIQRAEHRDTQALHAKLDELLKAQEAADSSIANIDEKEPETIEKHRARAQEK